MRTRIVAGIFTALLLAWGAQRYFDAPAPAVTLEDTGAADTLEGPVLRGAKSDLATVSQAAETLDEPLHVKVVDERGRPLSDVSVAVAVRPAHRGRWSVEDLLRTPVAFVAVQTAVSDAAGLASFQGLPKDHMLDIRAVPPAPYARTSQVRHWVTDEPAILVVRRGVLLRIRVVDANGQGRRAWVGARPGREDAGERFAEHRSHDAPTWVLAEQLTDPDGRLDVGLVPARPLRFHVFLPGRAMRTGIVVRPGTQDEAILRLADEPGCAIFGTVSDAQGNRVPDALVVAATAPTPYSQHGTPAEEIRLFDHSAVSSQESACTAMVARTDVHGAYRISGLPPGALTTLEVRGADGSVTGHPFARTQLLGAQDLEADFRFLASGWVRGTVVDENGDAMADVEVLARRQGSVRRTRTDADGRFALEVTEGGVTVAARSPALFDSKGIHVKVRPGESVEVGLRFGLAVPVEGRVIDANDAPVAGARVRFYSGGETPLPAPTTTDADGRFSFARVPPYHLSLNASLDDGSAWISFQGGTLRPPLVLKLQSKSAQAKLEVEVADATPDRVHLVRVKGPSSSTLATRADNRVVFERLTQGRYRILALDAFNRAAGETVEVALSAGECARVRLSAPLLHVLTGVVRDAAGNPVENRSVSIRMTAWEAGGVTHSGREQPRDTHAQTDANGRFRLDRLPAGDYTVRAAFGNTLRISIPSESVALTVPLPHRIAGTVLGPNGVVVATGRLEVGQGDDGGNPEHQPAADLELSIVEGRFEGVLPSASPVFVRVQAAHDGQGRRLRFVKLDGRERFPADAPIAIVLEAPPDGRIAGHVVGANDEPVPGVSVRCQLVGDRKRKYARTDRLGAFGFHELADGEHEIRAFPERGGAYTPPVPVRVQTDAQDVLLRLQRGIEFRGTLRYRDDGTPLAGQRIDLSYRSGRQRDRLFARTDAEGAFVFRGIPVGARGGLLAKPSKPAAFVPLRKQNLALDKHPDGIDLRVYRALEIGGLVQGLDQDDAKRCRVRAQQKRRSKRKWVWVTAATGSVKRDGTFQIGSLRPGHYRLVVGAPEGYEAVRPVEVEAGAQGVVLAVRGAARRRMHRVNGEVDGGGASCVVYWIPDDDSGAFQLELDASGTFSFETSSEKGTVLIRNEHTNQMAWRTDVRAGDRVHEFDLRTGGVVAGTVPAMDGRLSGGRVSLQIREDLDISVKVEPTGTFRLVGVPPGSFTLGGYIQSKTNGKGSGYEKLRDVTGVAAGRTNLTLELQ